MKPSRLITIVLVALALAAAVYGGVRWAGGDRGGAQGGESSAPRPQQLAGQEQDRSTTPRESEARNPMVTILMESGNEIKIELYPDVAPNTVRNFISLARSGVYDGTIFHRVIPGFMIQGGDPEGTGRGGPGYTIKGEFTANGFRNDLKHERGVVSMARAQHPDSAGSQFFIMVAAAPHLDGNYAAFGRVVSGMEEVDRIVSVPRNAADRPLTPQRMVNVTVEDFGVTYPEPEKL